MVQKTCLYVRWWQEEHWLETITKVCHVYHHQVHLASIANLLSDVSQRPELKKQLLSGAYRKGQRRPQLVT